MTQPIRFSYPFCVLLIAVLVSGCISPAGPEHKSYDADTMALVNVVLIDGVSAQPVTDKAVMVSGGKIIGVELIDVSTLGPDVTVIDLHGATLLPGLINTHVHFTPDQDRDAVLEAMLGEGVTTVRDLSGNAQLLAKLARPNAARPTLVYAGTMFGEGFVNDRRLPRASEPYPPGEAPWMKMITDRTDIAQAVAAAHEAGVTGLKLYASLDADLIQSITKEAHAQGLLVWSHSVLFPAGPEDAVAAGVDELIHSKGLAALGADDVPDTFAKGVPGWILQRPFATLDPYSDAFQALFADMRNKRIALNPALIADGDMRMQTRPLPAKVAAMRDWACTATGAAYKAGVMINAGTDYNGEGGMLFMEIERLAECGLSPIDAIKAATINAATILGLAATHGTIETGKVADLLAVRGNPASVISDLRTTVLVIKKGRVVTNKLRH